MLDESAARAAFGEKVRRGMFQPVERHLSHQARDEDRLAEGIGMTWQLFRRKALEGDVPDDALLVHACRMRAIDTRRTVVPAERRRRGHDVLNPRCFQQGRAEVVGLDDTGLATLGRTDPEPQLTSAIDLMGWVDSLPERDQVLVTRRLEGCTLNEIGREVGLSISATLAHLRRLGNALRLRLAAC